MQTTHPSVFARDHTLLGICEALGEDFGFNPLFLRIPLAVGLLWNPLAMVAAYCGLGVVVALTRWLVPDPRHSAVATGARAASDKPSKAGDNDDRGMALAA